MNHFIAYHKVDERGEYEVDTAEIRHESKKPKSYLRKAKGEPVWVISGENIERQTVYKLCSVYRPSNVTSGRRGWNLISGKGIVFDPYIVLNVLNEHLWFPRLLEKQGHFGLGFNETKDKDAIRGLQHCAMQSVAKWFGSDWTFFG